MSGFALQPNISHNVGGVLFDLPSRYAPVKLLGTGAFGIVIAAMDQSTQTMVAIKKIPNAFDNINAKRIIREVKLMRHFNHDNVLRILDILPPPSKSTFNDVYLVVEYLETDLQHIINSNQELTDDHYQLFLYQILRGLKAVHSAHVLHRDLKPSNLLVNTDCLLKICDFGLARVANPGDNWNQFLTEYVATRWYRAPEVILSWKQYTQAIDMWSVGCIFAELLSRKPLFPGTNYIHQVVKIVETLGTPPPDEIERITHEEAREYVRTKIGLRAGIPFQQLFPKASPLALNLLERMLAFDPAKRCTVEEAISHPYLSSVREGNDEPTSKDVFNFEFEKFELTKEMCQELMWREMLAFHPEYAHLG